MPKVLILSGDPVFQRLFERLSSRCLSGARPIVADDDAVALGINAELRPRFVLLHRTTLTRRDLALIRQLKADNASGSLFLLASGACREYVEAAADGGADGYFDAGSETLVEDLQRSMRRLTEEEKDAASADGGKSGG